MHKTDRDIVLDHEAQRLNESLHHTRIWVTGGGRKGPFSVTIHRLGKRQLHKVLAALLIATSAGPREGIEP